MAEYLITCADSSDKATLLANLSCVVNEMSYSDHTFMVDTDNVDSIKETYNVGVESINSNFFNDDDLDAVRSVSSKRVLVSNHDLYYHEEDTQNWGLLRHTNQNNTYATGVGATDKEASLTANYTYNYTGDGVDMVFLENAHPVGIENHAEFKTNGATRVRLLDWSTYVSDLHTGNASTDYTNYGSSNSIKHAWQVISTACSNTNGWATDAHIYNIRRDKTTLISTPFDAIRLWHVDKNNPSSSNYTGRPTVVVTAFTGIRAFPRLSSFSSIQFRDNTYSTNRDTTLRERIQEPGLGLAPMTDFGVPGELGVGRGELTALGTAVAAMEAAGVIHVTSAGNNGQKLDVENGVDYNNRLFGYSLGISPTGANTNGQTGASTLYPHRGSAIIASDTIVVGALASSFGVTGNIYRNPQNKEYIARFSARGPRVDCYAAGENLNLVDETTIQYNSGGSTFPINQGQVGGTSFACPQVGGMAALVLEKYPGTTPAQMRMFFRHIAKSTNEIAVSNFNPDPSNGVTRFSAVDLYDNTPMPKESTPLDDSGDPDYFSYHSGKNLLDSVGRITYFDPLIPKDPRTFSPSDFNYVNYTGQTSVEPYNYLLKQITQQPIGATVFLPNLPNSIFRSSSTTYTINTDDAVFQGPVKVIKTATAPETKRELS